MLNKEKNFVSVVAYLHNDEKDIAPFLDYITEELGHHFEKCELIFVNDASVDNSVSVLKQYLEEKKCDFMTNIINMNTYHGMESAMLAGVDLAIGDYVYEFDSIKLNYPRELFMDVYYEALKGEDIVAASPEGKVELSAGLFYHLYNRMKNFGHHVELKRETFRVVSRRAINRLQIQGKYIPYRKVMYQNSGLGYKNLMYKKNSEEKICYSSEERRERRKRARNTFFLFTNLPEKISGSLSLLFLIFGICIILCGAVIHFAMDNPVANWIPIVGFLAVAFSGMSFLFTILLKYVHLLLDATFIRKRYLISSIEKINR